MDVVAVAERLIQEQGKLDPLKFLQEIGVVSGPALKSWYQGKVACLDEVLQGDPGWIDNSLRQAARMARSLGLTPKTIEAFRVDGNGQRLALLVDAEGDPGREALFTTHYHRSQKKQDGVQLDLFLDTPETLLVNDVVDTLAKHDAVAAKGLLKRMKKERPKNGTVKEFRFLADAIIKKEELRHSPLEGLKHFRGTIIKRAREALGGQAGRFLIPFYRMFDQVFVGKSFDPQHPDAHRSWTLEQLGEWESLGECVLLEAAWTRQPVLLFRRAKALFHRRRLDESRQTWILFFWNFPCQAIQFLETGQGDDKELIRLWNRFTDREFEGELDGAMFPAWLLLEQPRLGENHEEWSEDDGAEITPGRAAFFLINDLMRIEKEASASPLSLELRRQLKEKFPDLFKPFMQAVRSDRS